VLFQMRRTGGCPISALLPVLQQSLVILSFNLCHSGSPSAATAASAQPLSIVVMQAIFTAFDEERFAFHQGSSQFFPCSVIHTFHGGSRYHHLFGALLLSHAFMIYETDGLILIDG